MKLKLNIEQRINLAALLGGQQALGLNLADLMLAWKLRERIALSPDEEAAAKVRAQAGLVVWDSTVAADAELEISAKERLCLLAMLERVAPALPGSARSWLPGLLEFLQE